MTKIYPDWKELNAYVDGELDAHDSARVARSVAIDPALADQVAILTRVKAAVADIADGIRYVRNHRELRPILNFTFLAALLGSAYMPVFPGFVADVLTNDPKFLGILIAVSAVGRLAGSMVPASVPDRRRGQGRGQCRGQCPWVTEK